MMNTNAHASDLVAGYAFGALNTPEREYVEEHLASCQECAESIWEGQELVALLPISVTPYKAPPDLKQTVLEQLNIGTVTATLERAALPTAPVRRVRRARSHARARDLSVPPWVGTLLLRTIPWTLAIAGWALVAFLLIYSHGQADRLAATRQTDQTLIANLTQQRNDAATIRQFLLTPGVTVLPLSYQAGHAPHTSVALFEVPGYIHAVIGARGLAVLPKNKIYQVWARQGHGSYVAIGTLVTAGPLAEGASVIVAPLPINQYSAIGISLEYLPVPRQPSKPPAFLVKL